jgi:HEAT repeat protein
MGPAGLILAAALSALPAAGAAAAGSVNDPAASVGRLREQAQAGDVDAILDLGDRRDKGAAAILIPLAQGPKSVAIKKAKVLWASRCALAKIGIPPYLDELIAGLAVRNPAQRAEYIAALGWVGDPKAAQALGPILLEKGGPPKPAGSATWAGLAAEALGEILPDVQVRLLLQEPGNPDRVKQWRRWWLEVRGQDLSQFYAEPGGHPLDTGPQAEDAAPARKLFK